MDQPAIDKNSAKAESLSPGNNLAALLTESWKQAMEVTDAQVGILTLKITRLCVITAFCVLGMVALTVFAFHGFFLLDACLAQALSQPPLPLWFAPLTRGILYFSIPSALLFYIWHTMVGYGDGSK